MTQAKNEEKKPGGNSFGDGRRFFSFLQDTRADNLFFCCLSSPQFLFVSLTKIFILIKILLERVLSCLPYQIFEDMIYSVTLIILIRIHYIQGQPARKVSGVAIYKE